MCMYCLRVVNVTNVIFCVKNVCCVPFILLNSDDICHFVANFKAVIHLKALVLKKNSNI